MRRRHRPARNKINDYLLQGIINLFDMIITNDSWDIQIYTENKLFPVSGRRGLLQLDVYSTG